MDDYRAARPIFDHDPGADRFLDDGEPANSVARDAKRFEIIPFDRISLSTAPAYLVRGVLPRTGLAVIYGAPKSGKSFFTADLLLHVALGWQYRGLRTIQGAVVYAVLEGAKGFEARIAAFRDRHLAEDPSKVPFFMCPTPLNLIADHAAFGDAIQAARGSVVPAVIAIDTVNRSLAGSESDDRDMGAYIAAAGYLAARFGCLVAVVHHSGVDATRPRGHTSLAGAVDAQISVKKEAGGSIVATVELSKDFECGKQFVSRLVPVDVGTDDEGEAITSCILEQIGDEAQQTREATKRRLPDKFRLAVDALVGVVLDRGEPLPMVFGIPGNPRAVTVAAWREELFVRGVLDRDAKNPRIEFKRLKDGMLAKSLASEREGLIWPM